MKESLLQRIRTAFIFWLARRLPDCRTLTPTIGESLDRKLSLREKLILRLHLFTCDACARYLKQVKFLSNAFHTHERRMAETTVFDETALSTESKDRMRRLLLSSLGPMF